jgi:hypothetical protein
MAYKFEIIESSLVITDTVSGDVVFDELKSKLYYVLSSLDNGVTHIASAYIAERLIEPFKQPLADAVDYLDVPFTKETFADFVRQNLGNNSIISRSISISVSNDVDALANQLILMTTGATDKTITLPLTPNKDEVIEVSKRDDSAGNLIVDGNGNDINGSLTMIITSQYTLRTLQFSGVEWINK